MVYVRPSRAPLGTVWARFKGRTPVGSIDTAPPSFLIMDVPRDMFPKVVDHMCANFVLDEPLCKAVNMCEDPETMEAIRAMWFKALEDRLSLVCVLDGEETKDEPIIVGVNICAVSTKDHHLDLKPGSLFERVMNAVMHITNEVDAFQLFGVPEYLGAFGLSVAREYRGQNIGVQILKARIPLCKAVGLKLTATVFTAVESQVLATKCGFQEIGEVTYKRLSEMYHFPLEGITTEAMKYMALRIC